MGIEAIYAAALATGTAIVSIAVYAARTRALTESTDHKVRNIQHWRDGLPVHMDATYVRQKELALELKPIHDALTRIEEGLETLRGGGAGA